ncbi:hypothetical protein BKH45_00045 [Helicobacter sp. 11S03491-1]|nr:hypothetical protein BKH45_00045 [Helicobacter sp. 11S03491-1]
MVMVADCNPILIYEPYIRAFALIHAGREGMRKSIITHTINSLVQIHGGDSARMFVFVGASIRKCCYEVKEDVALCFDKNYLIGKNDSHHLDLIGLLQDELEKNHIQKDHIEILPSCSCCQKDLFSYRREGVTGRFGLIGALK